MRERQTDRERQNDGGKEKGREILVLLTRNAILFQAEVKTIEEYSYHRKGTLAIQCHGKHMHVLTFLKL